MIDEEPFILVDWGSTNRRCYLLSPTGEQLDGVFDNRGVLSVANIDSVAEIAAIRRRLGDYPIVLAGMAGSDRGLQVAPYIPSPAGVNDLAGALVRSVLDRCWIVPGVKSMSVGKSDVMRGEELLVLGAVSRGWMGSDATACVPGTHCKWVRVEDGHIVSFQTTITGELFALLRTHSLLNRFLGGTVLASAAFAEGCRRSMEKSDLLGDLFGARAAVLLGERPDTETADYVSGLLIGADVAAHAPVGMVHLIADAPLSKLYARALQLLERPATLIDAQTACRAGGLAVFRARP